MQTCVRARLSASATLTVPVSVLPRLPPMRMPRLLAVEPKYGVHWHDARGQDGWLRKPSPGVPVWLGTREWADARAAELTAKWGVGGDRKTYEARKYEEPSTRGVTPPQPAPKLRLVTSSLGAGVKPYKVRASCGHIVVRSMREATAGVPYSESVVLDAPTGRACEACEAKRNYGVHAPRPAEKKAVKAPELTDTAQIAKRIREDIQAAVRAKTLPPGKYSVTTAKYAGGSTITVVAAKLPFPVLNPPAFRVMKGSSDVSFDRDTFRSRYTDKAEAVLAKLNAIVDEYHWDRSDPMTDYFHQRFERDVKLDDDAEWRRMNEAKKAAARGDGAGGEP